MPALAPSTYKDGNRVLAEHKRVYAPSIWWPVGKDRRVAFSTGAGPETQRVRFMPGSLNRGIATIAAAVFAVAATLLVAARRGGSLGFDALALLASLFFARGFFDPQNLEYYAAPGFVALIAWEVLARRRAPLLSAAAIALDALTFHGTVGYAGAEAAVYLAWVLPLTAYLIAVSAQRS
jgi:hypothetical protein